MSKKLCYYTCYFGGDKNYSKMIPFMPSQIYDCFFYTNNREIYDLLECGAGSVSGKKYIAIFVDDPPIFNCIVLDAFSSKEYKTSPDCFSELSGYEYTCWFDTKLDVYEDKVLIAIESMESEHKLICMTKHPYSDTFTTVWDEYNLAIQYDKYNSEKEKYSAFILDKIANGFSEHISIHYTTSFILRKMCEETGNIGELWYEYICKCGINCQISFDFIAQRHGDKILALPYQHTWKYSF